MAATGQMAEGFEAEQSDASGTGLVSCTHPGSDMWFVGTGQSDGRSADPALPDEHRERHGQRRRDHPHRHRPAERAEQRHHGRARPVRRRRTSRRSCTARRRSPCTCRPAIGQVAASVWEGATARRRLAAAGGRARDDPGDPRPDRGEQRRRLFVTVPGSTDAQLKVVAYTPAGAVAQFPGAPVDASAGATTPLALNSLGASAAGLKLTSNVPIVAGVLVPGAGIGSFTTAVAPGHRAGRGRGEPGRQRASRSACCSPLRRPPRGPASR